MFKFFKKEAQEKPAPAQKPEPLVENRDYYIENGNYVFTEYYHKKRGYCCQNGCRHCAYGFTKK